MPSWTADQAATIQAITAIVGIAIAIGVPWWQQHKVQKRAEKEKAEEIKTLRLALHAEVSMIALQCLREFHDWCNASPPAQKNLRTAKFPPLIIYDGNVSKIGLLSRDEILSLIAFSGTLHDIGVVVHDMAGITDTNGIITAPNQGPENRETLKLLLSNACQKAADFIQAVPGISKAEKGPEFVSELRSVEKTMEHGRTKKLRA
jgi:type II secretory pathway pseudopilin PulG